MTFKSILVHVEPTEPGRKRLQAAASLARDFNARLIGVGARAFDPMPDPIGLSVMKLKEALEADLEKARAMFEQESAGLDAQCVWRAESAYPTQAMLRHACAADLIVAARGVEPHPSERRAGTADLIMGAGLPVLTAAPDAPFSLDAVLIGWKNTREARRAVWDALPLLKRAKRVQVLRFSGDANPPADLKAVVERLKMHGVRAESEVRKKGGGAVADEMLAAADNAGAGLIVVGGYGHSRLQEWALGGVTQGLLQRSTKWVLYSH